MKKYLLTILITAQSLLTAQADHILFQRICVTPMEAEMVSLVNPTGASVDLSGYYLTDAVKTSSSKYYYNLPGGADFWSNSATDFIARFPNGTQLEAGDTLVVSMHTDSIFAEYYGYYPDLALYEDMENAVDGQVTISFGPAFSSTEMLGNPEVLILFSWDGMSATVKDVDYFLWGNNSHGVDKSGVLTYAADTPVDQQGFIATHGADSSFIRVSFDETGEAAVSGNGISGHDETSEDFESSWETAFHPEIVYGCTDPTSPNYNPNATRDDGSCLAGADELTVFTEIIDGQHDGQVVTIQGLLVDYFDVTVYNGPHSLTLEDGDGYRLECTVWPSDWDIPNSDRPYLIRPPFEKYVIQATGTVAEYQGEKQINVAGSDDFLIAKIYGCPDPDALTNEYGDCIYPGEHTKASINPAPFVLFPTLGEHLDYEYSFPSNSRVIVRVFDISGRFVTSLVDEYYPLAGEVVRSEDWAGWDGRDHLGQIVAPGTYFMHIEATDFQSGKTSTDIAPVVVGVKF